MAQRLLKLTNTYSVLLLGACGTGKSTLVRKTYPAAQANGKILNYANVDSSAKRRHQLLWRAFREFRDY
jgi:predicted AAA+ superfamily ATPase